MRAVDVWISALRINDKNVWDNGWWMRARVPFSCVFMLDRGVGAMEYSFDI